MDNVTFIHRGGPVMASYRLRTEIPAKQVGARINEGEAYIAVFSKPMKGDLELAQQVKSNGGKVVLDICDPHDYRDIARLADVIVVPTPVCADIVLRHYGRAAEIIPDPYEGELQEPHANGTKKVWVGHHLNYPDIEGHKNREDLRIVTGTNHPEGTTFWSPENAHRAMSEANWFLLPTRKGAEYKSPNRLMNAVRMGLFPICDPHPAYTEFRDLVWTGGVHTGLQWANEFRTDLDELVIKCQKYIEKYSPENVGVLWKQLLNTL